MMSFCGNRLKALALPTGSVWLISDIAEASRLELALGCASR
jgi:hypothetical protein